MASPFWTDLENLGPYAWDSLWLGGDLLPGVWAIESVKSRDIEKIKVKGSDGITLKDNGSNAPELTIVGRLWHAQDWELWNEVLPKIDPEKPGSSRTPLDIYCAVAELAGVRSIYIESIATKPPASASEVMTVTIKATKWYPETKATKTAPKASKGFDGADRTEWTEDQLTVPSANTVENL